MKKILSLLIAIIFAATSPVLAAGKALSDSEMDEIAAGAYVVTGDSPDEELTEVWYSNNDIRLDKESQTNIRAVSQANSVDSADVVQTNISSAETSEPISNIVIEGNNVASMQNYNPSHELNTSHKRETHTEWSDGTDTLLSEKSTFNAGGNWSKTEHHEKSGSETLFIDEDLVETLAVVYVSETESKGNEDELAVAFVGSHVEDLDVDYIKTVSNGEWHSEGGSFTKAKAESTVTTEKTTSHDNAWDMHETGSHKRENFSENNHIDLEDTAQTLIQAVSNLNSVGSASGIQTNLASNVGVAGTIAHSNIITHASNGL